MNTREQFGLVCTIFTAAMVASACLLPAGTMKGFVVGVLLVVVVLIICVEANG